MAVVKELGNIATKQDCFISLLCIRSSLAGSDIPGLKVNRARYIFPNIGHIGALQEDVIRNPEYYEHDDFWNGEFPCNYQD